jgi:DNA (cytosine-5)-methyltransferase 1
VSRPRLLDLFCCAGGAGMGYHRAGFDVVGVDKVRRDRYPFEFIQADLTVDPIENFAAWVRAMGFDAIHASPPCQAYSMAGQQWRTAGKEYQDLVEPTREALKRTGKPYVIENVPGAPLVNPVILNGARFGLMVNRTRLFECSFPVPFELLPPQMQPVKMGRPVKTGQVITPVGHFSNVGYAREQMEIDWMTKDELAQAIPPTYTEYVGARLIQSLRVQP